MAVSEMVDWIGREQLAGKEAFRPHFEIHDEASAKVVVQLAKQCWNENLRVRPSFKHLEQQVIKLMPSGYLYTYLPTVFVLYNSQIH